MRKITKNIKQHIGRKLRSESGASILFALLVLLVCVAVGSVVLTAGTAVGGRMSKAAEADQRFYAVQSAAELFRKQLDGQSVEMIFTKTVRDRKESSSYKDGEGKAHRSTNNYPDTNPSYTMKWVDGTIDGTSISPENSSNTLVYQVALNVLCGGSTSAKDVWNAKEEKTLVPVSMNETSLKMAFSDAPTELLAALEDVSVTCSASADGTMTFVFSSGKKSSGTFYSVRLKMLATPSDGEVTQKTTETSSSSGEGTQDDPVKITTISTTVKKRTSSVKWSFGSLDVTGK